jgi:hypothetical protein
MAFFSHLVICSFPHFPIPSFPFGIVVYSVGLTIFGFAALRELANPYNPAGPTVKTCFASGEVHGDRVMANPFKRFRKNRKQWLVFITVVCMFTFVIGSAGVSIFTGTWGCSRRPDFAVETKVRTISQAELAEMKRRRHSLNQLFGELVGLSFGGEGYGDVFNTWLKAQKARDMGIEVSDDAIKAFIEVEVIEQLVHARTQGSERTAKAKAQAETSAWRALNEGMKRLGFDELLLFAALRTDLLARRLDELFFGFQQPAMTPAERKGAWDALHRRVYAEVLPVRVQDFEPLVAEPSEETLKRFFELYARRLPDPDSPLPGFTLEHLAQFQYFQANVEAFDAAERPLVTSAEIKARYEEEAARAKTQENHRLKFNRETWLKELSDERAKKKAEPEKKAGDETQKKADGAAKPGDKEKPAGEKASPSGKSDGGAAVAPAGSPASDAAGPGVFPVAFQGDEKAKSADKAAGDAAAASDAKKDAPAGKSEKPMTPERTLNSIFLDLKVPQDIREGKDPDFWPLSRFEEDFRNELAKEHAQRDVEHLLGYLKDALSKHAAAWEKWNARPANRPEPPNPLSNPQQRMKLIQGAWDQLVEKRKEELTEALQKEKAAVEAELKRLAEEQKLSADDFRRRTEQAKDGETKNEAWLKLLADQKRLADVNKAAAELLEKWSAPLAANLTNFGPLSAPPPGGKAQIALIYQETAPDLTMREFQARSYALNQVHIDVDFRNLRSIDELRARRLDSLFKLPVYHPTVAAEQFKRGDEFLYWKIKDRPQTTPIWEHTKETQEQYPPPVLVDREVVKEAWKHDQARRLARERAEQLATQFRREVQRFPIAEVQRYFRIESGGPSPVELLSQQRDEMNFVAAQAPLYGVAVEIFENGQRRTLEKPSSGRRPLEAPPRSIFSTLAEAEQKAQRIAQDSSQANLLVIVGQTIGTLDTEPANRLVFRGVRGFYRPPSGQADAKDAKAAAAPAVLRWPGMVASDRDVEIRPFGGERSQPAISARGVSLRPFTWQNQFTRQQTAIVDGVDKPGETFFETTFALNRGELGVAFNRPMNVVYVIQVADYDYQVQGGEYPDDFTSAKSPLPERFAQDSAGGFPEAALRQTQQRYIRWIAALEEEYRVNKLESFFARDSEE